MVGESDVEGEMTTTRSVSRRRSAGLWATLATDLSAVTLLTAALVRTSTGTRRERATVISTAIVGVAPAAVAVPLVSSGVLNARAARPFFLVGGVITIVGTVPVIARASSHAIRRSAVGLLIGGLALGAGYLGNLRRA